MRELVRSVRKPPALVGNAFTAMLASNGDYKCHGVCRLPASDSKEDETPLRPDIVLYCPKPLKRQPWDRTLFSTVQSIWGGGHVGRRRRKRGPSMQSWCETAAEVGSHTQRSTSSTETFLVSLYAKPTVCWVFEQELDLLLLQLGHLGEYVWCFK